MLDISHALAEKGELMAALDHVCRNAERIIACNPADTEELALLARRVAEIRSLLQVLRAESATPGRALASVNAGLESLVDRYLELEGKVKELRNDRMHL
ncbi:MAG: hypothetical protein M0042_14020 [Nitrospiraceae bacterium]|nr:hypothetical protein [Nitrospiraceae bacterium]